MPFDPSEALQAGIVAAIQEDAALMAMISAVYNEVPARPWGSKTAFISFGPSSFRDEDVECLDVESHDIQIDVWTKSAGRGEVKAIVRRLVRLLVDAEVTLSDHAINSVELLQARSIDDPQQGIKHGVVQLRYEVEPA